MARRRLSRVSNSQDDLTKPLTEYTISILKTNPSDRSDATLKRLKQITYEIEFFKRLSDEYSEKTHLDCCKQMQYELVPCGCYVFMYGDVGDKFYIIVEGTADVLVPDAKDRPKKIGQLKAGNAFGELALIRNKPRMASVLCTSDCHLATLNKKDYDAILKSASKEQLESKVNFLASLHVFENWKRAALINLSYFFIEHSIKPKTLLYKEGSVVSKVFLVKKGEFKIYKTIFDPSDDSVLTCRLASKPKRLYLANVSVGEFLGVEDLMSGLKHSSSCESQARVNEYYEIWQNDFVSQVMNHTSFNVLKSKVEFTDNLRRNRIDLFSKQRSRAQVFDTSVLSPSMLKVREELNAKGLNSFGTDPSNRRKSRFMLKSSNRVRKTHQQPDPHAQPLHKFSSPTIDDLLAFNKSADFQSKKLKMSIKPVKKSQDEITEPLDNSTKLQALQSKFSLNKANFPLTSQKKKAFHLIRVNSCEFFTTPTKRRTNSTLY